MFDIDKEVPIPEPDRVTDYPLTKLEVGDSFVFPLEKRASVQSLVSGLKRNGFGVFTIKKISDTECRVWRVG